MPPIVLRLANASEANQIALMSRELIEAGLRGWSWNPQRVSRAIAAGNINVLAAEAKRHVAGFAIMEYGDSHAHLSLLAVAPSHQRQGLGRRMVAWLEETALVAGIEFVHLELRATNTMAHDFYRALGYTQTACIYGYYNGVEAALKMSRDIRRASNKVGRLQD